MLLFFSSLSISMVHYCAIIANGHVFLTVTQELLRKKIFNPWVAMIFAHTPPTALTLIMEGLNFPCFLKSNLIFLRNEASTGKFFTLRSKPLGNSWSERYFLNSLRKGLCLLRRCGRDVLRLKNASSFMMFSCPNTIF